MTNEEKQLLLKDICGRLQYYKLQVQYNDKDWLVIGYAHERVELLSNTSILGPCPLIKDIKPYLRPMSSMTEEEQKVVNKLIYNKDGILRPSSTPIWVINETDIDEYVDFCNSHFIDWRGLIPKGLALEAPEGMYKTK